MRVLETQEFGKQKGQASTCTTMMLVERAGRREAEASRRQTEKTYSWKALRLKRWNRG